MFSRPLLESNDHVGHAQDTIADQTYEKTSKSQRFSFAFDFGKKKTERILNPVILFCSLVIVSVRMVVAPSLVALSSAGLLNRG